MRDKPGAARSRRTVQGPAYCGHTAWVMAIMSELAYMRFREEDLSALLALPAELGKAVGRIPSDCELQEIEGLLATRDNKDCRLLRAVLAAGEFELVGVLSDLGTDTQGFVAVRRAGDAMDMAVVSFRGTENEQDWKTNLRYSLTPAGSSQVEGGEPTGKVHQGFFDAFKSVRGQVDRYLPWAEGLPIFITGHSLGAPWQPWGRRTCRAGAWRPATPSEHPVSAIRDLPATCEFPCTAWSIPWTRCLWCRAVGGDTVIWATGRDSGGHVGSTRCEKSAAACFACAGLRGASFLRRTSSTIKSTDGTISEFTGRSCGMTLAVWTDTGPSARG